MMPEALNAAAKYESILFETVGPIAVLTLNRPQRRNALSLELMREVIDCLSEIGRDRNLRVVLLKAAGKVFSSGHDLSEMVGRDINEYRQVFDVCTDLMTRVQSIPQPVIAEVQGIATAAGCQLVASCDLAIASSAARFATPGVNIGLFCSTPMVALSRNVSRKHAMEMLLTGEMISAAEAHRVGLINRIVSPETLADETMKLAELIATKPHGTLKIGKEAFYKQVEMGLSDAYDYASRVMTENMLAAEAAEGIGAFVEKREPKWPE